MSIFSRYGSKLFDLPTVQVAPEPWQKALQLCHKTKTQCPSSRIGLVKVHGRRRVNIPAGSIRIVAATRASHFASSEFVLVEPLSDDYSLPEGLLVSPALVQVVHGTAYIPVVNVGQTAVTLHPRLPFGLLTQNQVVSLPAGPEQDRIRMLLLKHGSVFSAFEGDIGCTDLISHDIPLLDDTPVRQGFRHLPPSDYDAVKAHIHKLLETQVIRESSSPYASPIVLVRKKDGSLRLCVDYRQLNHKTRKDAFPLLCIEESLDVLSEAKWFSTLDLASGYNQVPVTEQDKPKTAFCTPFGLFEFNRMLFGLCNAPSTFQRLMERIFGAQHCQSLLLYLDDVIVFSSSVEEHLSRLDSVLRHLQQERQSQVGEVLFLQEGNAVFGPPNL
ncbi:hypothetical protein LDENG_00270030 [Lucifuga dentata]|nr:hypothetical protein LDENG_00270030 [Lucifuga dentata]